LTNVPSACVIYVPTGTRNAYIDVLPWSNFTIEESSLIKARKFTVDKLTYLVTNKGEVCAYAYNSAETTDLEIPATVTNEDVNYSVTSIEERAFMDCTGLTAITIPNSVTSIGFYAFGGCSGLASISIPGSVTSIGKNAFDGCSSLTAITIPNSVTNIGDYTFWFCSNLASVTTPNFLTNIGEHAFEGCTSLTSISIPNSLTSIEDYTFYSYTFVALTNAYLIINKLQTNNRGIGNGLETTCLHHFA